MARSPSEWTTDNRFEQFPTVDIEGRGLCLSVAPAQNRSWGIEGFVFSNKSDQFGTNSLDWYRAHNREGNLYLYGRETQGEWGLVRVIQGDAWGGTQCGTEIPWALPAPIAVEQVAGIALDYQLDTFNLLTSDGSWIMIALNLWISAPEFPKPLVIDLVLHYECNNAPDCSLRNFEDDPAFHYMIPIDNVQTMDYGAIINEALNAEYRDECDNTECIGRLPAGTPTLQQFEFVIEVHRAEAAAFVNQLALYIDP